MYGRRHSKLFTNCHVSWDTLYNLLVPESLTKYLFVIAKKIFRFYPAYFSSSLPFPYSETD